jgi:hypothetical protein
LAAWDVRQAELFGRLVTQVMEQEPYFLARRVFWVVDTGSSHRGQACLRRIEGAWPNLVVVHLPIHASWLNQIEIYFSIRDALYHAFATGRAYFKGIRFEFPGVSLHPAPQQKRNIVIWRGGASAQSCSVRSS